MYFFSTLYEIVRSTTYTQNAYSPQIKILQGYWQQTKGMCIQTSVEIMFSLHL